MTTAVRLLLPFTGRWLAQNSPLRRVPSHGTELLAQRHAIDFVGVDDAHRSAHLRDWRTLLATEPPERFFAFGRPILAPGNGVVVETHDGEADHPARRSQLALVPYMLSQRSRLRQGVAAVAGNYVIMRLSVSGSSVFIALVHLRSGSIAATIGEQVVGGQLLAECGNSGNSTQPHVHIQAMDSRDIHVARGLPIEFMNFREWRRGLPGAREQLAGLPAEGAVVEPMRLQWRAD